jgi:hypothetical protein
VLSKLASSPSTTLNTLADGQTIVATKEGNNLPTINSFYGCLPTSLMTDRPRFASMVCNGNIVTTNTLVISPEQAAASGLKKLC